MSDIYIKCWASNVSQAASKEGEQIKSVFIYYLYVLK